MTLVYRTPKEQIVKPLHNLGPGSYMIDQQIPKKIKPISTNSCVFASSTDRDLFDTIKIAKEIKDIEKIKVESQTSNCESHVNENSNLFSEIKRLKKSTDCRYVFNSKVQRFNQIEELIQVDETIDDLLLAEHFKLLFIKDIAHSSNGKVLKAKHKIFMKKKINSNQQTFPSIPNWDKSYGYRFDLETNKWVSNENPNIIQMLAEKEKLLHKNNRNHTFGSGYNFFLNKENLNALKKFPKDEAVGTIIYSNLKPEIPIYNSIEENQKKIQIKIKLKGNSELEAAHKILDKREKSHNYINSSLLSEKNQKSVLLLNQIYKKFHKYIPKEEKHSPAKFIEKIKEAKLAEKNIKKEKNIKQEKNDHQYFLAKSQRFVFDSMPAESESNLQDESIATQSQNINESFLIKTHNCRQPYSLGQRRFKEIKDKEKLGPGAYNVNETQQEGKLVASLNFRETRFIDENKKSDEPGPGDYNISFDISKKTRNLIKNCSFYKNMNRIEIQRHSKQKNSMGSLYQEREGEMNFIVKYQKDEKCHLEKQSKIDVKSLAKVKWTLQKSLAELADFHESHLAHGESFMCTREGSELEEKKSANKAHPKLKKHLYEYKKLPKNRIEEEMGPGKYLDKASILRKTFNVTYS